MILARVEEMAGRVTQVAQHAWPVLGTWRAVTAAFGSLKHSGATAQRFAVPAPARIGPRT